METVDATALAALQATAERLKQGRAQSLSSSTGGGNGAVRGEGGLQRAAYRYMPDAVSGLDVEVRHEVFECARCEQSFTHPLLYAMEPNPDDPDGPPVSHLWGGDSAVPTHCNPCVEAIRDEEEARREAAARAVRMDPENPEYRKRLIAAGIKEPKLWRATLKNFDRSVQESEDPDWDASVRRSLEEAYTASRSFVEGILSGKEDARPWRFFTGPTGTAKTHLMIGIDRALYVMGYRGKVAVVVAPLFVEMVQAGYADKSASGLLAAVRDADVALVDDLGRGRQSDDRASMMNELLCLRAGRPTLITSNYTRKGLVQRNAEFMTLASRLGPSSCWSVELLDRDRRDDAPQEDK